MGKYSIIIVLGLFISVLFIRLQTQGSIRQGMDNYVDKYNQYVLRNIANSGANAALNALMLNVESTTGVTNRPWSNGKFSYFFERRTEDARLGPTMIRVTSIAEYLGRKDTISVLLTRPSFSRFAYFTNTEGSIWFAGGDTLTGPTHTNDYFHMSGTPGNQAVFKGKVTSHKVYSSTQPYEKYYSSSSPEFHSGTEWLVPELKMPNSIPMDVVNAATADGITFSNRYTWIKFQNDSTALVCSKSTYTTPTAAEYSTYNLSGRNGVIYAKYSASPTSTVVHVEGTVSGKVTVASEGVIKITGNLVCNDNPAANPNSTDIVGLVATRDVVVANNTYLTDRTIQATMMTMNPTTYTYSRNFYVENYSTNTYGYLHVYGGIIQYARGAVGQLGTPHKGYLKNYKWDPRLKDTKPPSFPMLLALRKIAWYD